MRQDKVIELLKQKNLYYDDSNKAREKLKTVTKNPEEASKPIITPLNDQYPSMKGGQAFLMGFTDKNKEPDNAVLVVDQYGTVSFFEKATDITDHKGTPYKKEKSQELCQLLQLPSQVLEKGNRFALQTLNKLFKNANTSPDEDKKETQDEHKSISKGP